jgi:FKBP-type peptidyl-prolyl cis-trans isomerase FkpA
VLNRGEPIGSSEDVAVPSTAMQSRTRGAALIYAFIASFLPALVLTRVVLDPQSTALHNAYIWLVALGFALLVCWSQPYLAAHTYGPRASVNPTTAIQVSSVGVAALCTLMLRDALPHTRTQGSHPALLVTLLSALVGVAAAYPSHSLSAKQGARIARGYATVLTLAACVLCAGAALYAQRAVPPERYLHALEVFARLPAQSQLRHLHDESGGRCQDTIPLGELSLVRNCESSCRTPDAVCDLSLERRATGREPAMVARSPSRKAHVRNNRELLVRIDRTRELLVIEADTLHAFDLRSLQPLPVSAAGLKPPLSAPFTWRVTAALFALAAVVMCFVARRRMADAEPVEATLRDDRTLLYDGRALVGVTIDPSIAAGPVVVFLTHVPSAAHYRDDAPQPNARVEAGTLTDHRDRAASRTWSRFGLAAAFAALSLAPTVAWTVTAVSAAAARPLPLPVPRRVVVDNVEVDELTPGNGEVVTNGKFASVHYVGRLVDGTEFDSSRERQIPFEFSYGAGQLIRGFELGMRGMRVGAVRRVTIPPQLGYGARGAGSRIPPHATLVFEIELLSVR